MKTDTPRHGPLRLTPGMQRALVAMKRHALVFAADRFQVWLAYMDNLARPYPCQGGWITRRLLDGLQARGLVEQRGTWGSHRPAHQVRLYQLTEKGHREADA